MKRFLILSASVALAACATVGTPQQSMYAAYATYSVAVKGAADYAEGPAPDPKIVHALNTANQRPEVKAAVTYGRAYVLCQGDTKAAVAEVDCALFDFRQSTASAYAITLRSVATSLLNR